MVCGIVAFTVCVAVTPIVGHACRRFAILDQPGSLKIHEHPLPRLGGIAIALGIAAGSIMGRGISRIHWDIAVSFLTLWAAGLLDDLVGLRPIFRLCAQTASAILLWHGGLRIGAVGGTASSIFATCVFVVAFVNAFNFLDGADGLAAGVSCIVAVSFILVPRHLHSSFSYPVAYSIAGACAAFLFFNFPPATIFMGDSGSTVLGFGLALLGLSFPTPETGALQTSMFLLLAAALPLVDAAFAMIRRACHSRSPFEGDRRHGYDLMLARGWPPRKVAVLWYAITVICAIAAWFSLRTNTATTIVLSATVLVGLLAAGLSVGSLRVHEDASSSKSPAIENSAMVQSGRAVDGDSLMGSELPWNR